MTDAPDDAQVAEIAAALRAVRARIASACVAAGRAPDAVELVAVSKTQPVAAVRAAYAAGQRVFGENYVQELVAKAAACADLGDVRWHFVGHLQRNKARDVARVGATVESLDSARLAAALAERAEAEGRVLDVFVQVNVAAEPQKSGCAPEDLPAVLDVVRAAPGLRLHGLMTVPPADMEPRSVFDALAALAARCGVAGLSMGMSGDLEAAIAAGATHVRVGTAIFGTRRVAPR